MIFSRADFPLFSSQSTLGYLDNAATTQKPSVVINAMTEFYTESNTTVYRGIYELEEQTTKSYEAVRSSVARYSGAFADEIVFTRGATEGINLIATSWAANRLVAGDEIIISELEHHANILPWIRLEKEKGIVLKYIPITREGTLNYEVYQSMLTSRTKLVSLTHTSNVLGTRIELSRIIEPAKQLGIRVLVDATQAAGREHLQLQSLGADFVVFSGHKMLGPTGIGVLYIARNIQNEVVSYQLGGGMVHSVGFHEYQLLEPPRKYEAGTPAIASTIGLGAAIDYLSSISFEALKKHEAALCARLITGLEKIPSLRILGPLDELKRTGHIVSFVSTKAHAHDVAAFLDRYDLSLRAGNHCAQPLHTVLGIDSSVRASFYGYTSENDIDRLIEALDTFERSF